MGLYTYNGKVIVQGNQVLVPSAAEPSPCSGYDLCLTSEEGNFIKDGSDLISQWTDGSGNGNDAIQAASAEQPLWLSNVDSSPAVYFLGTDKLKTKSTIDLTNKDWTIEFQFKLATVKNQAILYKTVPLGNAYAFGIMAFGADLRMYLGTSALRVRNVFNTTNFKHVVVQNNNGTIEIFINGVSQSYSWLTAVWSGTVYNSDNFYIGYYVSYAPDMYIDDIKIKAGETLYTENFTPPTRS